jgi:ADP-ribose pyrophosphatase
MLPALPKHHLTVVEERSPNTGPGFLRLRRQILRVEYEDGSLSEPFEYDAVDRVKLDAVVIVAHFRDEAGARRVFLRSCVRPPLGLRPMEGRPMPEKETLGNLWEAPAGLVEEDERTAEGLLRCAARELHEEVGFQVDPSELSPLGPSTFPAPGIIGERHFYFHVEVDAAKQGKPPEDGSPLERHARVAAIPLEDALELVRRGEIEDEKTELALRRLAEIGR